MKSYSGKQSYSKPANEPAKQEVAATPNRKRGGSLPAFNLVMKTDPKSDDWIKLTGIFANLDEESGAVRSYTASVKETITIPAGAKLFLFKEDGKRKPE